MGLWRPFHLEVIHELIFKEKTCSSTELDCVADQDIDGDDCLENCEGTIVDDVKLSSSLNGEELAEIISDYEKFKYPYFANLTYPVDMKG